MNTIITREEAIKKVFQELDIPPSKYKQAIERFESMKCYLMEGEYERVTGESEIYLQGSFKLGTEIRPYRNSKDADYDIDIVCRLEHRKEATTSKEVKLQVGNHLKNNDTYKKMLDGEGKRCWTLNYAEQDSVGFHIDILRSIQDSKSQSGGIVVTNKNSDTGQYEWSPSNPKGFAKWFYGKNKHAFDKVREHQKKKLFERHRQEKFFASEDAVPNIHVKTPLQRAIQLLKRHRDIRFCSQPNEKCKPISMVITVLAARIYSNEITIYETLKNIIDTLSRHANQMQPSFLFNETTAKSNYKFITKTDKGQWRILNPTNHGENFADKWHEKENGIPHARAKAFFEWVKWAKEDFLDIEESLNEEHYMRLLKMSRFDVPQRTPPHWPIKRSHLVQVSGHFKTPSEVLFKKFGANTILEKGCELRFEASTKVSKPFDVYWQVVNTGTEAKNAKGLRGEIIFKNAGDGSLVWLEETRYAGFHWVECFIVKGEECVARSGEFIVNIK